jgi:hypothetical protein
MALEEHVPKDTRPATRMAMRRAAERNAANPASLAKALRIVAAADPDAVRAIIDQAPALTPAQVDRLRALLPPAEAQPLDAA